MKKIYALLILFIFIIPITYGQIRFGPRVGFSATAYNPESFSLRHSLRGTINAGLYAKFSLTKKLNIQTELMYAVKGEYITEFPPDDNMTIYTTFRNRYIDFPILASVGNNFCLLVGVVPSLLLKSDTEVETIITHPVTYEIDSETETTDSKEEFKSFDFGICLGFEYEFNFGLNYGFRVNYGLMKFDKTNTTDNKNLSILLSIGYSIGSK